MTQTTLASIQTSANTGGSSSCRKDSHFEENSLVSYAARDCHTLRKRRRF